MGQHYKLERLLQWEHVKEVNEMLLSGAVSPYGVSTWCKERGFSISQAKLYEYKEMLQQAAIKQITIERLLGMDQPKRTPIVLQALGMEDAKNMVRHEMEVLDVIIQRGYSTLLKADEIGVNDVMKAIELKHKLTGGSHGGLTGYGIDELRELEERKFESITQVVLKYIPEDKIDEIQEAIQQAEKDFYEDVAPQYVEEYEKRTEEEVELIEGECDPDF
jgi:hypothetical protein